MAGRMISGASALAEWVRPGSQTGQTGLHRALPVYSELEGLLPGGGLRRGSTVSVGLTFEPSAGRDTAHGAPTLRRREGHGELAGGGRRALGAGAGASWGSARGGRSARAADRGGWAAGSADRGGWVAGSGDSGGWVAGSGDRGGWAAGSGDRGGWVAEEAGRDGRVVGDAGLGGWAAGEGEREGRAVRGSGRGWEPEVLAGGRGSDGGRSVVPAARTGEKGPGEKRSGERAPGGSALGGNAQVSDALRAKWEKIAEIRASGVLGDGVRLGGASAGEVGAGGGRTDEARAGQGRMDEARAGQGRVDEARVGQGRGDEARVVQGWGDEARVGGVVRGSGGSASLLLALVAAASGGGAWCAVVGVPGIGAVAAAESGVALERLVMVPNPGPDWPTVVAALIDGVDIVVVGAPAGRVSASIASRLAARARQRGCVLVPYGPWDGADVTLQVTQGSWEGLGDGHGRLRRRKVTVTARGRGAASRPREATLWMPGMGTGA